MLQLTMDLNSSAAVLGTEPSLFLEFAKREHLAGILKFDNDWRVSIFTLARVLDTSPDTLLEFLEDYALGQLIAEVENEELLEGEAGWQAYQVYLAEEQN